MHARRCDRLGKCPLEIVMHPFFKTRVVVSDKGCWLWKGSKNNWGYGRTITPQSPERGAHRVSWDLHNGPIPEGSNVLHKCDTPACVNPDHLYLGSLKDNVQDAMERGRHVALAGEKNGTAKLTREAVEIIRTNPDNLTVSELARRFGVSRRAVRFAREGTTWK